MQVLRKFYGIKSSLHPQMNIKIERFNRTLQEEFLDYHTLLTPLDFPRCYGLIQPFDYYIVYVIIY